MTAIFLAANLPTGHKSEVGLANLAMSSELLEINMAAATGLDLFCFQLTFSGNQKGNLISVMNMESLIQKLAF